MSSTIGRFRFGSVQISALDLRAAVEALFGFIAAGQGGYIACTCMHGIVESESDLRLRSILNASLLTLPDGMPTVWVGRAKGFAVSRVTASDFLAGVLADPRARALRHYFLGGSRATLEKLQARAARIIGDDALAGCWSPPLREAGVIESAATLEAIASTRPDVLWVGLGLPKQEYWMDQHARHFPRTVMVGIGATFDWFGGTQARAPRWLQALGLEWAHRVACEPRRLWPRYRQVVPRAMQLMARELAD